MNFKQFLFEHQEYQVNNTGIIEHLKIRKEIPNLSSIQSSLNKYKILSGIRNIPISEFKASPNDLFYDEKDFKKTENLSKEIEQNKEISPLIVVIDDEGPYVLEGAHRLGALYLLGKKFIPALVVLDLEK